MATLTKRKIDTPATLAIAGAILFWSTGPIFIRYLAGYMDSWAQNMLRYTVGSLFWLPFLIYLGGAGQLDKRVWKYAIVPAAANIIMQSLWARVFYYIEPAFGNLLSKSSAIWVIGFSMLIFTEERALLRSPRFWFGMILSIAGVIGVLVFKEDFSTGRTIIGVVLVMAWAFIWGLYTVSAKMAFKDIDVRSGFSVISIYTVFGLGVLWFIFGDPLEVSEFGLRPWLCIIFSAITSISLSHVLYYYAVKRIGATISALVLLVLPFTVLGLSYIVFGEMLNIYQLLFGIILLVGAGISIWAQQHLAE
jgi:drug/metabolite transporter (DMT)-like permease